MTALAGMPNAYGVDSGSVLRVLDTGMSTVMFVMPWFVAVLIVLFVWLENRRTSVEESSSEALDFGVLVISAYQTVLSQSAWHPISFNGSTVIVSVAECRLFDLSSAFGSESLQVVSTSSKVSPAVSLL